MSQPERPSKRQRTESPSSPAHRRPHALAKSQRADPSKPAQSQPSNSHESTTTNSSDPPSPSPSPSSPSTPSPKNLRHHTTATLYDAVAGRITTRGAAAFSRPNIHHHHPRTPATVDHILRRRKQRRHAGQPRPGRKQPESDESDAHSSTRQQTRHDTYQPGYNLDAIKTWTGGTGSPPGIEVDDAGNEVRPGRDELPAGVNPAIFAREGEGGAEGATFLRDDAGGSDGGALPGSDLLKAVHRYCGMFYAAVENTVEAEMRGRRTGGKEGWGEGRAGRGCFDFKSFDETALLGLGVLLEEACRAYVCSSESLRRGVGSAGSLAGEAAVGPEGRCEEQSREGWRALVAGKRRI